MTPLSTTAQATIASAVTAGDSSGMVAAVMAAKSSNGAPVRIEYVEPAGWMASDAAVAESVIAGWSGSAAQLAWHRAQAAAALFSHVASIAAAGRIYSVAGGAAHTYQIDAVAPAPAPGQPSRPASLTAIGRAAQCAIVAALCAVPVAASALSGAAKWPADFAWRDAANANVPMTAAEFLAFAADVWTYTQGVRARQSALEAAITGAQTVAAVAAIDVTTGWPSNP